MNVFERSKAAKRKLETNFDRVGSKVRFAEISFFLWFLKVTIESLSIDTYFIHSNKHKVGNRHNKRTDCQKLIKIT